MTQTITIQPGETIIITAAACPPGSTAPPPTGTSNPPPTGGNSDYIVPASLWTFGAAGSAGGNYRLEVPFCKPTVTVQFTTGASGTGAVINLQTSNGSATMHTMTIDGKPQQSQTPSFVLGAGVPAPNRQMLLPNTAYVITIATVDTTAGTYHINFQNSPY